MRHGVSRTNFRRRTPSVNEQGFAARDNVYVSAGFVLRPGQALVVRGRYPRCRFANVVLWNRFIQSLDYTTRQISLNRTQTTLEPDGSFKIVIAGSDPGVPNWLDTEGRTDGMVWWRFLLPEENIEPLISRVVPLPEVKSALNQSEYTMNANNDAGFTLIELLIVVCHHRHHRRDRRARLAASAHGWQ